MDFKKIVFGAIMVAAGIYFSGVLPNSGNHPNAPEGALEYWESSDGSNYLILFKDELVIAGPDTGEDEVVVDMKDIQGVRTTGYILVIAAKKGELKANMPSTIVAKRWEDKINELRK